MKQIAVSTKTFSLIWAARVEGEESEDEILARLLARSVMPKPASRNEKGERVTWLRDVVAVMTKLGRAAHLSEIYERVGEVRRKHQRSMPENWQPIVRRTLEEHCPDSEAFKGKALFSMPEGKGAGVWMLA